MSKNTNIFTSTICQRWLTSASQVPGCQSRPEVSFLHILSLLLVQEHDMDYYAVHLGQQGWSKNHSRTHIQSIMWKWVKISNFLAIKWVKRGALNANINDHCNQLIIFCCRRQSNMRISGFSLNMFHFILDSRPATFR